MSAAKRADCNTSLSDERWVSMHQYELTERGKILVAIVLVLLLLLVPSVILLCGAMENQPPTPSGTHGSEASQSPPPSFAEISPPIISNSPPPTGGGFSPPDVTTTNGTVFIQPDVTPTYYPPDVTPTFIPPNELPTDGGSVIQETPKPPDYGPTGGNPSRGTLTFLFSPDKQNTLDAETLSMVDTFIKSPSNTRSSLIRVETPKLSAEDTEKLASAVTKAFTDQGVPESRISYSVNQNEVEEDSFEVNLSYIPRDVK